MRPALRLTMTTPASVLVDSVDVLSVRAEDESGSFGILPGHTDLLTVLRASVIRWQDVGGAHRYCALRGGVLTVSHGRDVAVACREGIVGDDLDVLEERVGALRDAEADRERCARVEQMRLHARAVRQLMRFLRPGGADRADLPIFTEEAP